MKNFIYPSKILAILVAAAVVVLFFFPFVTVTTVTGSTVQLTGFEMFSNPTKTVGTGDTQIQVEIFKSFWYFVAGVLSALTLLFAVLGIKFKGTLYAAVVSGIASIINLGVLRFNRISKYADTRKLSAASARFEPWLLYAFIVAIVTVVFTIVALLIFDYYQAMQNKTLPLMKKVAIFIRDYKSELKKIVWPNRQTVTKNTIVVLTICAIVGSYIWLLDFGLSELIKIIFGI